MLSAQSVTQDYISEEEDEKKKKKKKKRKKGKEGTKEGRKTQTTLWAIDNCF